MHLLLRKMVAFFLLTGLVAGGWFLTSCGPGARNGYRIEKGEVVLYKGFPATRIVLDEADAKTFKIINDNFGKDKNHAYYLGNAIPEADPATFEHLGSAYSRDAKHGYSRNEIISNDGMHFSAVPNPDESNQNVTAQGIVYARDSKQVYNDLYIIEGADPATFQYVPMFNGNYLATDKYHVYFKDQPIKGPDGATFRKVSRFHFCTKTGAWGLDLGRYTHWEPIADVDLASFQSAGEFYAKDKDHVYFSNYVAKNADPVTFKETEYLQGKDKYRSYSSGYSAANKNGQP